MPRQLFSRQGFFRALPLPINPTEMHHSFDITISYCNYHMYRQFPDGNAMPIWDPQVSSDLFYSQARTVVQIYSPFLDIYCVRSKPQIVDCLHHVQNLERCFYFANLLKNQSHVLT